MKIQQLKNIKIIYSVMQLGQNSFYRKTDSVNMVLKEYDSILDQIYEKQAFTTTQQCQ